VLIYFFYCVVTHICFECVVIHLFECVVTLIIDRLGNPFLCKGLSSTSVKLFFSISAQPQLLEVESSENVGIVSRILLYFMFLFDLFSCFFDYYILVRIKLN
jgi:hypothetical protein